MKSFLKENKMMILFFVSSLINGWLLRVISTGNTLAIRPILGDMFFLLVVCLIGLCFTKKRNVYFLVWSILVTIICCINSMYFNEYHDYVSIYLIETMFQAFLMPSEAVTDVIEILDYVYIFQAVFMIVAFVVLRKQTYSKNTQYIKKGIFVAFGFLVFLMLDCNMEDIYRLKNDWNKEYVVRNFGVYNYQLRDVVYSTSRLLCKECGKEKAKKEVDDYFEKKERSSNNQYTDIFKGKNLLLIHGESLQTMFIDDVFDGQPLMPNVSKMIEEGMFFSNFYSEESVGTSSDTEFTLQNSLLPIGTGTVFVNFANNQYRSMPSILGNEGYSTFSMHGNICEFWKRNEMYDHMGYQRFYCYNDYDQSEKIGLGLADKSFFKQSVQKLKEMNQPFYGTMIMLSNHTPFHINDLIDDYPVGRLEGTKIGNYLKMVHYADQAIGELLQELENENLLENTVVVLYGDHDSKLKEREYQKYFNTTDSFDFYEYEEFTKVPLIIWTKDKVIQGKIEKVMGMIDVFPTLANMFGFDSSYTLGHDIFSTDSNIVVFPNGNWITDELYRNNQMNTTKVWKQVGNDYMEEKERQARKMVEISNKIVKYDLFR